MDIVSRFGEIANQHASRVALVYETPTGEGESITYEVLNSRRKMIAGALAGQHGVRTGDRIGVCQAASPDVIVAMLAIASLGACFVPLDAELPRERQQFIHEDAGLRLCLAVDDAVPAIGPVHIGTLSGPSLEPDAEIGADTPLYVMFTSGSTGTPKGVVVPHRAVHRLVVDTDFMELGPDTRFLQLAPQSFDASTLEIWGPLLNGGTCVLYPGRVADPEIVRHFIADYGVNSMWLTCALFNQFVSRWCDSLRGLDTLLFGGERASVPHVRQAYRALATTRLINGYGPTENTTFTACHTVTADDVDEQSMEIPIGKPIKGTDVKVVDGQGRAIEGDEQGELLTTGLGLALGYLNREELTAERFIVDENGRTWYRTGDLVTRSADGVIRYRGRIDRQVKLDGHRIEPGEIEIALMRRPSIRQAHVMVVRDANDRGSLVAWVVGEAAEADLKAGLSGELPRYMVPGEFVFVDSLPVTANGKVDTARLPEPVSSRRGASAAAAATGADYDLEQTIESIWRQVVAGLEHLSVTDNFFDAGGSSMDMLRVKELLDEALEREVPVVALFEFPTVAKLAAWLRDADDMVAGSALADDRAARRRKALARRRRRD